MSLEQFWGMIGSRLDRVMRSVSRIATTSTINNSSVPYYLITKYKTFPTTCTKYETNGDRLHTQNSSILFFLKSSADDVISF